MAETNYKVGDILEYRSVYDEQATVLVIEVLCKDKNQTVIYGLVKDTDGVFSGRECTIWKHDSYPVYHKIGHIDISSFTD